MHQSQGSRGNTPQGGPGRDLSEGPRPGLHMAQLSRAEGKAANDTRKASQAWTLEEPCARMVGLPPEDGGEPGRAQLDHRSGSREEED